MQWKVETEGCGEGRTLWSGKWESVCEGGQNRGRGYRWEDLEKHGEDEEGGLVRDGKLPSRKRKNSTEAVCASRMDITAGKQVCSRTLRRMVFSMQLVTQSS